MDLIILVIQAWVLICFSWPSWGPLQQVDTLRPRKKYRHFADDIFKRIFLNENLWIFIQISPKFVPKGPINNIPALVQIMAWRRTWQAVIWTNDG